MKLTVKAENPVELRKLLESIAEPDFRDFAARLIPGMDVEHMLGIRLPKLRKIAAAIAKSNWREYLDSASDASFEETMLQGMVIGYLPHEPETVFPLVRRFVDKIDNWSICDSFCAGLKIVKSRPRQSFEFILPYLSSHKEYYVRFGIVTLIVYYINDEYLDRVFELLDAADCASHYASMAAAWAVSICYRHNAARTREYLSRCKLDDVTYRGAVKKITELMGSGSDVKAWAKQALALRG